MSQCKFCGSPDLRFFQAQERMLGIGSNFRYAECLACGSLQSDSIPENLSVFYPSNYYSFTKLKTSTLIIRILKFIRMQVFIRFGIKWAAPIYGYWLRKIHPGFTARIADVGCGNGQLLYELYAGGYTDLQGFDPFLSGEKQLAPGLKLWNKRIEESESTFDLIMMHHAFEHMGDPHEVLSSCYRKLNPGGKLLIRCPVADAAVWKEYRELWVQLDAPRHLVIPTVSGLKFKAEQSGFVLDDVVFDSTDFQFWGTELYQRGEILEEERTRAFLTEEERATGREKARRYNQEGKGDQACFYFSKRVKA
jgi:SAM-dependent methyltransferase